MALAVSRFEKQRCQYLAEVVEKHAKVIRLHVQQLRYLVTLQVIRFHPSDQERISMAQGIFRTLHELYHLLVVQDGVCAFHDENISKFVDRILFRLYDAVDALSIQQKLVPLRLIDTMHMGVARNFSPRTAPHVRAQIARLDHETAQIKRVAKIQHAVIALFLLRDDDAPRDAHGVALHGTMREKVWAAAARFVHDRETRGDDELFQAMCSFPLRQFQTPALRAGVAEVVRLVAPRPGVSRGFCEFSFCHGYVLRGPVPPSDAAWADVLDHLGIELVVLVGCAECVSVDMHPLGVNYVYLPVAGGQQFPVVDDVVWAMRRIDVFVKEGRNVYMAFTDRHVVAVALLGSCIAMEFGSIFDDPVELQGVHPECTVVEYKEFIKQFHAFTRAYARELEEEYRMERVCPVAWR